MCYCEWKIFNYFGNLCVCEQDRGDNARSSSATLMIMVKDSDDLPPKFTETIYRTRINENSPITVSVASVLRIWLFLCVFLLFQHLGFFFIIIICLITIWPFSKRQLSHSACSTCNIKGKFMSSPLTMDVCFCHLNG